MLKNILKKITHQSSPLDAYRFNIDNVNEKGISGWAHKIGDGNYAANIEIRSRNVSLYSIIANIPRKDLQAAAIGSGNYGFTIKPSAMELKDNIDTIDIFIDGFKANVKPFPLILPANVRPKTKTPSALVQKQSKPANIQMHLDGISADKIFGWAKKQDSITHRSLVELKADDVLLGSDTADKFRQSIKNANIGDGCYCFEIIPKVHLFASTTIQCDLYIDGSRVSVKPIQLSVDDKTLENAKFKHEFANEISEFSHSVNEELTRLAAQVKDYDGNNIQVAIENIASLAARMEIIENILTKYFAGK